MARQAFELWGGVSRARSCSHAAAFDSHPIPDIPPERQRDRLGERARQQPGCKTRSGVQPAAAQSDSAENGQLTLISRRDPKAAHPSFESRRGGVGSRSSVDCAAGKLEKEIGIEGI